MFQGLGEFGEPYHITLVVPGAKNPFPFLLPGEYPFPSDPKYRRSCREWRKTESSPRWIDQPNGAWHGRGSKAVWICSHLRGLAQAEQECTKGKISITSCGGDFGSTSWCQDLQSSRRQLWALANTSSPRIQTSDNISDYIWEIMVQ